jgi:hypothetical protein
MKFMLLKRKECAPLCPREDESLIGGILYCVGCDFIRIDRDGATGT